MMDKPKPRYIPVPKWNTHHEWPPIGGLRHLIFFAETNGFKTAFKRVGRRVLVDEAEFFRIVEKANSPLREGRVGETPSNRGINKTLPRNAQTSQGS